MKKYISWRLPVAWFGMIGLAAIIGGGMLSAFMAKQPSTVAMWTSAYMVLVVGLAQIGCGVYLALLGQLNSRRVAMWFAFSLYNLGNIGVVVGTIHKTESLGRIFVDSGTVVLAAALICMVLSVRGSRRSRLLISFYVLVAILLVSACIGLWLSRQA